MGLWISPGLLMSWPGCEVRKDIGGELAGSRENIDRICFDYFFVWHIIEKEAIRLLLKELLTGS